MRFKPAHVIGFARAGPKDEELLVSQFANGEITNDLALFVQHGRQGQSALARHLVGQHMAQPAFRPRSGDFIFCEGRNIGQSDPISHGLTFRLDMREGIGSQEGDVFHRLHALGRVPQRLFHAIGDTKHRIHGLLALIDRGGAQRAGGGQFLIRETDLEPAGIVFPHPGIGIGHCRPIAIARHIHAPDIKARIAIDHPVRQRQADPAALAEPCHNATGAPVILQAAHWTHQRVAIGREGEGSIDDLFDPGALERWEVTEANFQRWRDTIDIFLQQFMAEIPGCLFWGPRHAGLFIGAHQHALAFLTHINLAIRINDMQHFLAGGFIDLRHFGHVFGDQIHMFHGQNRQFQANHAPDFPRPQTARIDHMIGLHGSLFGDHGPGAVRILLQVGDAVSQVNLCPAQLGRLGIGMGRARWIQMPMQRCPQCAQEFLGVHDRQDLFRLFRGQQFGFDAQQLLLALHHFQQLQTLWRRGQEHTLGQMETGRLAGNFLDLFIQINGIGLQLRDLRVAIDGVKTARRMPGRPGCQFRPFDQNHIFPTQLGQMIQYRTPNNPAPDYHRLCMRLHMTNPFK